MQLIGSVNGLHVCVLICRLVGGLKASIKNGFRENGIHEPRGVRKKYK
jgi:hypothetical protein